MIDSTPKHQRKKRRSLLLLGILLGLAEGCAVAGEVDLEKMTRAYDAAAERARTYVAITYWGASAPLGRFLLIRKGTDVCAIRFTKFYRGGDAKQPTLFHSGDESLYAEYDWFYQGDGSGDFTKPTVKSGQREASSKAMVGIGRMSFARGKTWVKCGPFQLGWLYPNNVSFYLGTREDFGIELAPTKWQEITEVNPHDPRLTWYRFDGTYKRPDMRIPVDALW